MRTVIHPTAEEACTAVASFVVDVLRVQPDAVLGLPTGHTPIVLYRSLVEAYREGRVDFSRASTFNLDEFAGIPPDDPRSFRAFMREHLLDHVNLPPDRVHILRSDARDWTREARRFEADLAAAGGLDVVILGIGRNGHVAFNEPAPALEPRTHLVRLRPETRRANAALAGGAWRRVPARALSMGMATILNGRAVVLLATGPTKARIVRRALTGPITTRVPASLLQTHPNLTVVLDRAAASAL